MTTNGTILALNKTALGLLPDDTVFDVEILMAMNAAFSVLTQLGVGPSKGFNVESKTEWSEFTSDASIQALAQVYVYLTSKLLFDPPETSFARTALKERAVEYEWRLRLYSEELETSS